MARILIFIYIINNSITIIIITSDTLHDPHRSLYHHHLIVICLSAAKATS
jgi:hypothetical protein